MSQKLISHVKFTQGLHVSKGNEIVKHSDEITEFLSIDRHIYEIIEWTGNGNRLYFDYEKEFKDIGKATAHGKNMVDKFISDGFNVLNGTRKLPNGMVKISLHGVHKRLGCKNMNNMKNWIKR